MKKNQTKNRCTLADQINVTTVHKIQAIIHPVFHYCVDKSMALTVMTLCYSKHKALRQSPCLLWRLQKGSTQGKGTHSREGCVRVCVCVGLCVCVCGIDLCALCSGENVMQTPKACS